MVVPDGRHAEWVITHERLPRKKVWLASDVQSKLLSMRGIRLVLDEVRPEELGSVAPGAVIVAATENEWAQVQPWRNDTAC